MSASGRTRRAAVPLARRRFLAGVAAGAAALTAGGCARGTSTSAQPGTTSISNDNATWDDGYRAAGHELKKITGYALRPLSNPSVTSYQQVVQMTLQTSKASDLVKWASGYQLKRLARAGGLTDLSPVWQRYAAKGWVRGTSREAVSYRGKAYGIPLYESYYVLFYSKPVFAKLGLSAPSSWDGLLHCAEVLKRNKVTPFLASQVGGWPAIEWFQELVSKVDPHFYQRLVAGQASYTDAPARQAMDIWHDFMRKGWMTSPDFDQARGPGALKEGTVGMFLHGTWQASGMSAAGMEPGTEYGAFILPTVRAATPKSVIAESGVFVVPGRASSHDAAMANVAAWLDPSVQRVWSDFLQDSSANPKVRSSNPVVAGLQRDVARNHRLALVRYWESGPPSLIQGNTNDLGGFMAGQTSPATTLRRMQERAGDEWAAWKRDEA
ncbi:extracellular solute-binding protein [Streptomyces sp. R1]|uniref:ABC transporter substrate-binding protein n=1 Tax=Streptomyces TaxID=1883 RepID=UPI00052AA8F8|nr:MULTISPECIES: extracellular solute-binding protein [unclassified Streptomyces]AIV38390.1 extracellular binding protein [Streptomyces sp. CCM_MD2014]MCC8336487.1 extracellular solute-binding protein [Streptomyces sp. R1]MYS55513.1 extracellular solute-binding protein [Streptomyces sp. SID6013]